MDVAPAGRTGQTRNRARAPVRSGQSHCLASPEIVRIGVTCDSTRQGMSCAGGSMGYRIRIATEAGKRAAGLIARVGSTWHGSSASSTPRWVLGKVGFWVAQPGLAAAYRSSLWCLRVRAGLLLT